MEHGEIERHGRTDESRGKAHAGVRQTEKIVVDFLAGGIEDGDAGVQVLRHAVRLDGVAAGVVGVVEQAEGVRHDVVVGIEEHNHVVFVGSIAFHHLLDGVDLGAVLLVGHYDVYGHLQQGDKVFFGQLGASGLLLHDLV